MGQCFIVRVDGNDSEAGVIGRGTRYGCPLSPLVFNNYIQQLMSEALDYAGQIQSIHFAGDQEIVAVSEEGLQRAMEKLNETSEEHGM